MHDILRFLYLYTNLITKWCLLFLHEQLNFWKEVWTLPTQYLVGMLCLMLPLKVWTWETESVGHISSGVRCWEFYGWSPVTTSAVAERVNRTNITLQSYLYKQTEYASGLLWSDDSRLAWHLNAIRPFVIIMHIQLSSYLMKPALKNSPTQIFKINFTFTSLKFFITYWFHKLISKWK